MKIKSGIGHKNNAKLFGLSDGDKAAIFQINLCCTDASDIVRVHCTVFDSRNTPSAVFCAFH